MMTTLLTVEAPRARLKAGHRRDWLRGQALAISLSMAAILVQTFVSPGLFDSPYLIGVPVLLACALLGGRASVLTGMALVGLGAMAADLRGGTGLLDGAARLLLFVTLGLATAIGAGRYHAMRAATRAGQAVQRQREALLQSSLDAVQDAIVIVDADGAIHSYSRAAERLFGWRPEEVLGRCVRMLVSPEEDPARLGFRDDFIGAYRKITGRHKDGSDIAMEMRGEDVMIGDARFFTAVVRDRNTLHEAERRSEELRAQLTQVWSLNSMGEMASVLAHELNQPLSAVANYMRAARTLIANHEIDDDDLLEAVSRAGDQAVRAGEIIRTMRDLATRGGMQQRPESMSAIIGEIDFIVGLLARDAGVRVTYDLYKGDDLVHADRIQIQQLLVNLVRNGIEAMLKYPIRQLSISTRVDSERGIVTTISDSGPGVDPSVATRLFQPLASTKPTGMGLGLSISTAIIENHKGHIWVEPSNLGGAAFCFVLARAGSDGEDVVG